MADNQNMNKLSMKDVQQQHLYQFKIDERVSKQDFR